METITSNLGKVFVHNLTPHDIHIKFGSIDGAKMYRVIRRDPQASVVAIAEPQEIIPETSGLLGVDVVYPPSYSSIRGLPADSSTNIIVSKIVAEEMVSMQMVWTGLVLVPDTGPDGVIRDDKGRICGTKRLMSYDMLKKAPW